MGRISYVNGRYLRHSQAMVSIEDRGYQFADGIYEVIAFYNRRFLDAGPHLDRLERSLRELSIPMPMGRRALEFVAQEILDRNDRNDGTLYFQITRGVARRDHLFPKNVKPSLVMTVGGMRSPKPAEFENGVAVIALPDQRWARRDIKSIGLLPNVLAKQRAAEAGAREAWLLGEDGMVLECAVSNNAIVNAKGEVITHPATHAILGGISRHVMLGLARGAGIKAIERPFSLAEAKAAKEAFITGTTSNVLPVVRIDGGAVGDGRPGPVTKLLQALYYDHIFKETGKRWN